MPGLLGFSQGPRTDRPGSEMTPRLTYLQQVLTFTPPTVQNGASFLLISALSSSFFSLMECFICPHETQSVDDALNPSVRWFMDQAGNPSHQKD